MAYEGTKTGIEPSTAYESRTTNWKSAYLEVGGIEHRILDKIYDYSINQFTNNITQEMRDTLLHTREDVDTYVNKFFTNGNTVWKSDFTGVTDPGETTTYWFTGQQYVAGTIGVEIKNGVIVRAAIGISTDAFMDGTLSTQVALNQELLSVKAIRELLYPEKPSTLDGGGSATPYINNNAMTSVEWYQTRTQELARQGAETKGIYGWDIDQQVMEEAAQNPHIQNFINTYATNEAKAAFQAYLNNEKSATLPENAYEIIRLYKDKDPELIRFTEDNYHEQLEKHDIKGFERESIEHKFAR